MQVLLGYNINKEADIRKETDEAISNTLKFEVSQRQESENNLRNELLARINSLASGAPLSAASTKEMTDKTKVYVNTTDGKWYYFNGTTWTIGGTYQAPVDSDSVELLLGKKAIQSTFEQDEVKELYEDGSYKITKFNYDVITETWHSSDNAVELVKTITINSNGVTETTN